MLQMKGKRLDKARELIDKLCKAISVAIDDMPYVINWQVRKVNRGPARSEWTAMRKFWAVHIIMCIETFLREQESAKSNLTFESPSSYK